jgi:guanylate kinase
MTVTSSDPGMRTTEAPAMFRFSARGFVLVVSGPSGAGKGTLVARLMRECSDCTLSISATTRPPRAGEQAGVQYEFVSREEFEKRRAAGLFLEWAEVHGHLYATPSRFVEDQVRAGRVVVLEVDVQGGASLRKAAPDAVSVFIVPPSIEALRERLEKRNTEGREAVEQRLRNAPRELEHYKEYDYLVLNDDLESAALRLVSIVNAERTRVTRQKLEGGSS